MTPRADGYRRAARFVPLALLVVYLALAFLTFHRVWHAPGAALIGPATLGGDAGQAAWWLRWTPFAIGHGVNPLLSDYINYPRGVNVLWNGTTLAGVLLAPVTLVWGPITAYNVGIAASCAISAWFAYVAVRRLVPGHIPAACGGLVYGFSPYMLAQAQAHLNLVLSATTIPLFLILGHEALVRQRWRWQLVAGLASALALVQYFIDPEVLITVFGAAIVVVIASAVVGRRDVRARWPMAWRSVVGIAIGSAVLLAGPIAYQIAGPAHPMSVLHPGSGEFYVTDLLNPVLPTSVQLIAPHRVTSFMDIVTGNITEADGYIGIPLLLLIAGAAIWQRRSRLVQIAAATGIVITILSFGGHLHIQGKPSNIPLPWWLLERLPVLVNLIPSRFMLYVFLAVAVLCAVAIAALARTRVRVAGAVAVFALCAAPLLPSAALAATPTNVPAFFTSQAVQAIPDGAVVLAYPWPSEFSTDADVWQAAAGLRYRMLGGYFVGPSAPGQDALFGVTQRIAAGRAVVADGTTTSAVLSELRTNGVAAVVVGPGPHVDAAVAFFSQVLGGPPQSEDGVELWLLGR